MFHNRWRLFRLLGIPIYLDASWLIILALLTLSLATGFPAILHEYFPGAAREPSPVAYWTMGLVTALAFFACILLHELGHALVARLRGMSIRGINLSFSVGSRRSRTRRLRRRPNSSWPSPGLWLVPSWPPDLGCSPLWATTLAGRIRF